MIQAHHDVRIERPIDEVFEFLADGTNNPSWQPLVVRCEPSDDLTGVGHSFNQRLRHPLGFTVSVGYRITEYQRPARLTIKITGGGPLRPTITYDLEPAGPSATTVHCTMGLASGGVARVARPVASLLHPLFAWETSWVERIGRVLDSTGEAAA